MITLRNTVSHLVLAIVSIICISGCRGTKWQNGRAEVIFLERERSQHFGLFAGHHPAYIEFGQDGTYRKYLGSSTGETFLDDEGLWQQSRDGTITVRAKGGRADVIAEPLTVYVGGTVYMKYLPKVKAAIVKYLEDSSANSFPVGDSPELGIFDKDIMDVRLIGFWKKNRPTHFTRTQLEALVKAIEAYRKDSSLRYRKVKLFRYKKQSFLIPVNYGLCGGVDKREVMKRIDRGHHKEYLLHCYVGISEQDFNEAITPPVSVLRMQDKRKESNKEIQGDLD